MTRMIMAFIISMKTSSAVDTTIVANPLAHVVLCSSGNVMGWDFGLRRSLKRFEVK